MFGILRPQSIQDALIFGQKKLAHLENPTLEAEVLLAAVLRQDRVFLKKNPQIFLNLSEKLLYLKYVKKRAHHWPVAYILGQVDWAELRLMVNKNVLIPRDETEILWEHIKADKTLKNPLKILDIGTGSGCLSIACAKHFTDAQVTALDISEAALLVARKNAAEHNVQINFLQSDLLEKIAKKSHFDLIIANLPYVPETETVSAEVRREPHGAIFSGGDGLNHIRRLAEELRTKNMSFEALWLEFLPTQAKKIHQIFGDYSAELKTDVGGEVFFAKITS